MPGGSIPPGKGVNIMSIQSDYLLESVIQRQEAARAEEATRKLDTVSDEIAARDFAQAMEHANRTYESGRDAAQRVTGAGNVTAAHGVGITAGPGDAILGGITMLRSAYDARIDAMARSISDVSRAPVERFLDAQIASAEFSVMNDAVSKTFGKVNQTVGDLLKSA